MVAIDPAATSGEEAGETGIVVIGKDHQGHGYVLGDASGRHQPADWAKIAVAAYRAHHADRIVAKRNNGGALKCCWLRSPRRTQSAGIRLHYRAPGLRAAR